MIKKFSIGSPSGNNLKSNILNLKWLALGAMLFALCGPALAQQVAKVPRIGFLSGTSAAATAANVEAFRQGLRELGYAEGNNIAIEYRFAEGKRERLAELVSELVRLKVDIIVAENSSAGLAAKAATKTIPIVLGASGHAIGLGLVDNLARPGGNITGLSFVATELSGKRLELLKEVIPKVSRVAVLWSGTAGDVIAMKETESVAPVFAIKLQPLVARDRETIEAGFSAMAKEHAQALIAQGSGNLTHRTLIAELAVKHHLPTMFGRREFVDDGGLMSYGVYIPDLFHRAATYVDKILKGTKPGDLPLEQPTKFELVINLKTSRQIGVTIPPNLLARADKVIK
ncbi:MAG TPA: ABC transporter substrate-binding protein [Candidatus Binatia bacterium]|jgi:putative ABC transport system substrate-binding protein